MTTLLFLMGIAAFLVVVVWTYANDGAGAQAGEKGLLAMKGPRAEAPAKAAARWNRASPATGGSGRPAPRWRGRET